MDFTTPIPGMPKEMDEFFSLLTATEPSELSEVVSSSIPTVPGESETLISKSVSVEPSETTEILSNSNIAAPSDLDDMLSRPTPTTSGELEESFTIVKSAEPNEIDEASAALNPTETRGVGDVVATFSVAPPTELEELFATLNLPEPPEIEEWKATESYGHKVAWKRNAMSIARIEKHLAIVALLFFVASLLILWIRPFEDVSPNPEVTARNSDDSQRGSDPQSTVVEANLGTKQGEGIESPAAFQPSSGEQSLDRSVQGSTSENSRPNSAASNPSRPTAVRTTEPDQLDIGKALPPRKRENDAEKKKVSVDDLITDKKKVTVDDLINDN